MTEGWTVPEQTPTIIGADDVSASPRPAEQDQRTFADFPIRRETVDALAAKGIISPFPIQSMTLPVALGGRDIIGQAKTGTGKTLGFGIPMLENVVGPGEDNPLALPIGKPQALVVLPTRELAIQVAGDLEAASSRRSIRIVTVYGGRSYDPQIEALTEGVEIVVGTPGRLIDLMRQKYLDLSHVRIAVLDEADEMLDLGFLEDIEKLLGAVPSERQTMLFSATMPGPIVALARRYMKQPTHIRAHDPGDTSRTKADIKQVVYRAHALDKIEVLARMLQARGRGLSIVFTRTKREADRVAEDLQRRGFAAAPLHGDLGQGAREQALRAFRHGKVDVLIATDVAARGIDVDDVTHVVNYNCPDDDKTYLHRTGRTGRAGKQGTAITFVDWEDLARWALIARALGLESTEVPETYSTSPHLFTDLDIPEGTKGTLPRDQRTREGLGAERLEDLGGPDARGRHGKDQSRRGDGSSRGARSRRSESSGDSRSRRGSDGAGATARDPEATRSDKPRRQRTRSRTKRVAGEVVSGSGQSGVAPSEAASTSSATASESAGAVSTSAGASSALSAAASESSAKSSTRRRRRSRGGRGQAQDATS
ncbi:DEAD/DEAH box helicase [Devriesea agamarum]|uniref:DEAD/DEAH box helicase n=1 Tax=Devriesea agamarum TaxID=472569 RepID=UPI0009FFA8CC|nr:DEAD/DEAH box helicase [Devriesea agamarum]